MRPPSPVPRRLPLVALVGLVAGGLIGGQPPPPNPPAAPDRWPPPGVEIPPGAVIAAVSDDGVVEFVDPHIPSAYALRPKPVRAAAAAAAPKTVTVQPGDDMDAALRGVTGGDTLVLAAGLHKGIALFNRRGEFTADAPLKIVGAVDAAGKPASFLTGRSQGEGLLIENTDHVAVRNLVMENARQMGSRGFIAGFRVVQADDVSLTNCRATGNKTQGFFTGFANDFSCTDCVGEGSVEEHGFYCSNSSKRVSYTRCVSRNNRNSGFHNNGSVGTRPSDGRPLTGLIEGITLTDCVAENNGAGGGAAINLDGCTDVDILRFTARGNRAGGIAAFVQVGAAPTSRVRVLDSDFDMPAGSRVAVAFREGANTLVLRGTRIFHPDRHRAELMIPPGDVAYSDYNQIGFFHEDNENERYGLAEWQRRFGHDRNSADHAGVRPVPVGPPPALPKPAYAAELVGGIDSPDTVFFRTATPVTARLKNLGTVTWRAGGDFRLGTDDPRDDTKFGFTRLQLQADTPTGQVGTFAGSIRAAGDGTLTLRPVLDGVRWFPYPTARKALTMDLPPALDPRVDGLLVRVAKLEAGGPPPPPPPPAPTADYAVTLPAPPKGVVGAAGTTVRVEVTAVNAGTETWTPGGTHRLGTHEPQDDTTFGPNRLELVGDKPVPPGGAGTFAADVVIPAGGGTLVLRPVWDGRKWLDGPRIAVPVRLP